MNESLASGLDDSVEEPTELTIDELSQVLEVVSPIPLHDLQDHDTQCTAVVKSLKRGAVEVAAGALVRHLVHHRLHPFKGLMPIGQLALANNSAEKLVAAEVGRVGGGMLKSHLFVELVQPDLSRHDC